MRKLLAALSMTFVMAAPGVQAAECNVPGFSVDEDPRGLNIRKGPGSQHAVIGVVPNPDNALPPDLLITGAEGNWLRLGKVDHGGAIKFKGTGWVFAKLVRTAVGAAVPKAYRDDGNRAALYARPDTASKISGRVPGATEIEILACTGRWVKTTYGGQTGWLRPEDVCGDPVGYCQ